MPTWTVGQAEGQLTALMASVSAKREHVPTIPTMHAALRAPQKPAAPAESLVAASGVAPQIAWMGIAIAKKTTAQ